MTKKEAIIILTEDDDGHVGLILYKLKEAGVVNKILHFNNGEETLDFFFKRGSGPQMETGVPYILLLDIRLPGIDGIEILRLLKEDKWVDKFPVIMISVMGDPEEIEICKKLGCNNYFVKAPGLEKFSHTKEQLGQYINEVILPEMSSQ
jgi:DNA-binding response OmpR family regulator